MSTSARRVVLVLAVLYLVALAGIAFWPSPVDRPIDGALMRVLDWLHGYGLPAWFIGYRKVEFAANIVLFIPFGMLATLLLPARRWWLAVVAAAAVSGGIETTQGLLLPARVASWSDLVANTSGALAGAAAMALMLARLRRV
ncbi:VanZ family protein [Specibacter cremeus]|uniref:VanZ family protein n=1 Tax=Specibacter cremeus TaxID=1629051 RepID=UPI000F7A79E2|nr:VanZ family protein [Specibacter cremeus]